MPAQTRSKAPACSLMVVTRLFSCSTQEEEEREAAAKEVEERRRAETEAAAAARMREGVPAAASFDSENAPATPGGSSRMPESFTSVLVVRAPSPTPTPTSTHSHPPLPKHTHSPPLLTLVSSPSRPPPDAVADCRGAVGGIRLCLRLARAADGGGRALARHDGAQPLPPKPAQRRRCAAKGGGE